MPAWTPAHSATDIRQILGNLITFFQENQVAALAWASPTKTLPPLTFYRTAEMYLKSELATLPHFGIVKRRLTTDDADDGLRIRYDLTGELEVRAVYSKEQRTASITQLQLDTDAYDLAIESMFVNCPPEILLADVPDVTGHFGLQATSSDPLEVVISDTESLFNIQKQLVILLRPSPYGD